MQIQIYAPQEPPRLPGRFQVIELRCYTGVRSGCLPWQGPIMPQRICKVTPNARSGKVVWRYADWWLRRYRPGAASRRGRIYTRMVRIRPCCSIHNPGQAFDREGQTGPPRGLIDIHGRRSVRAYWRICGQTHGWRAKSSDGNQSALIALITQLALTAISVTSDGDSVELSLHRASHLRPTCSGMPEPRPSSTP